MLHFEEKGSGKYTFILLHNAGGDSSFFTQQIDVLIRFGKVVLIDLHAELINCCIGLKGFNSTT